MSVIRKVGRVIWPTDHFGPEPVKFTPRQTGSGGGKGGSKPPKK